MLYPTIEISPTIGLQTTDFYKMSWTLEITTSDWTISPTYFNIRIAILSTHQGGWKKEERNYFKSNHFKKIFVSVKKRFICKLYLSRRFRLKQLNEAHGDCQDFYRQVWQNEREGDRERKEDLLSVKNFTFEVSWVNEPARLKFNYFANSVWGCHTGWC